MKTPENAHRMGKNDVLLTIHTVLVRKEDNAEDIKKISDKVAAAGEISANMPAAANGETATAENADEPKTAFAKMKAFVRKAVDCCIE